MDASDPSFAKGTSAARPSAFWNSYVTVPPSAAIFCLTDAYGFLVRMIT